MRAEYDADNFDMEQTSGVDNPEEPGDVHDTALDNTSSQKMTYQPKAYTMQTRFKTVDKKTGQLIYRVVKQPSSETRKLVKPFSYQKK